MNETLAKYKHEITEQIIHAVTAGNAPWQRPLIGGQAARNAITDRRYQGINQIILRLKNESSDPRWLTYKQVQEQGWQVKKGSHGIRITFWRPLIDTETEEQIGQVQRVFTVFNATQIEGISEYTIPELKYEQADRLLARYEISNDGDYSEAMRKLIRWTKNSKNVTHKYSGAMEELITEIGSLFLMGDLGLTYTPNQARDRKGSLEILNSNSDAIFKASAEASRTVNFLLGRKEG